MRQTRPPSPLRPRLVAAAMLATLQAGAAAASEDTSPWVRSAQSEARLVGAGALSAAPPGAVSGAVSGGPGSPPGELLAGVEIRLQPRFITYWRDPGDAGVPPTFSFAGSSNLKAATVRYPAPTRLDEAGAEAFGYEGSVVFPVLVTPEDPAKPVALAVTLDYAACHDICLPAHADLRLTVDARVTPEAARLRDALSTVPRRSTVGAPGPAPEIVAVSPPDAAGGFTVRAALPEGAAGTLFVEAPEGWAYAPGAAMPDPAAPGEPGRAVFPVKRLDAPRGEDRPAAPLTLTLVAPGDAVEVPATLDAAGAKP